MITIYGIKNCDTMKKAFSWLEANNIPYTFVDYKRAGIAESHLSEWIKLTSWESLLNTRGLMWKKLTDEERANIDAYKAHQLMIEYPSMIKRPVLYAGKKLLIGFSPETYAAELK